MAQELEVNRDLINPNFNSYRLSPNLQFSTELFPICDSIEERNLERIQTLELGNNDYSYSHVAMATSLNNLCWDRKCPEKVYFVTNLGRIMGTFRKKSDNTDDGFDLNRRLFTISDYHPKHSYASLSFPSSEFALILHSIRHGDETFTSSILIINRNPTESNTESWSCDLDSGLSLSSQALVTGTFFKQSSHLHLLSSTIIVNSDDNDTKDSLVIHLIFGSVNENSSQTSESNKFKSRFCSILHWIVLEKSPTSSSSWTLKLYRRLTEGGLRSDWPRYVAFEHFETKLYLVVASEGRMKVDLMIDDSIVDQSLSPEIGDSTLIQPDSSPKQDNMGSTNNDVSEDSPQFVDGIEDCDKDDLYSSLILSCFEADSGRVINEFDLSSQKWLFTVPNLDCRTNLPFIVLRHDVDAFVYRPVVSKNSVSEIQFSMKHVDTFDALGYIQASKTNKTFMTLSSSFSASLNHQQVTSFTNALIADSIRNVYLYRSDHENRNSGTQFIFNLGDNCGSIHGLYSFPLDSGLVGSKSVGTAFYVLSKHCLYFVKF